MKNIISNVVPKMNIPSWATHIAIQASTPKIGMAVYAEEEGCFIDEDISKLRTNDIATSYDERYWEFVAIDDIENVDRVDNKEITLDMAKKIAASLDVKYKFTNYIIVAKDGTEVKAVNISHEFVQEAMKSGADSYYLLYKTKE